MSKDAACHCERCPGCANIPRGKDYLKCRPCAVGWHATTRCAVPLRDTMFPIETTCATCGFALDSKGVRHL